MVKKIKEWIFYIILVLLGSLFIVTFIGQRTIVDGDSMNNTLQDGDNLIVDKLSYRFSDIDRFDIVVFRHEENEYYIKRIIGLPGETVQIVDDTIYINGEPLEEHYGKEPMESAGLADELIPLGEDEYFVLGDNRNDSSDSRDPSVGNVHRSAIAGRAFMRITPFKKMGLLLHK